MLLLRQRFGAPPVHAALLVVAACIGFASMNAIIRHLGTTLATEPLIIVFCRNLFAVLAMAPWIARHGRGALRTERFGLIALRAVFGFASMAAWFTALAVVPLANAVALSFTAPLFAAVAALLLLHEAARGRRIVALLLGFCGMLAILRPGWQPVGWGEAIVLASAVTMALSIVTMKMLTRSETAPALVAWQAILLTPLSLLPALFVWRWPAAEAWLWLAALGAVATAAHLLMTRAFAMAEASYLLPFTYARLPFVALIGWLAFSEATDLWTWVGAAVIAASTIFAARGEARTQRGG